MQRSASGWFEFLRGGREGGKDTHAVWNVVVDYLLRPVISRWADSGFGLDLGGDLADFDVLGLIWVLIWLIVVICI